MSVLEAVQTVQYVTVRDKRFAVIAADEWEALVTWLETLEDLQIFKNAYAELAAYTAICACAGTGGTY